MSERLLPAWKYMLKNNKHVIVLNHDDGTSSLGYYEEGSNHIVEINDACRYWDETDPYKLSLTLEQEICQHKTTCVGSWLTECAARHENIGARVWDVTTPKGELYPRLCAISASWWQWKIFSEADCETCSKRWNKSIPERKCHCGLYSITDPKTMAELSVAGWVVGLVRVSGKVLQYSHGFRSQRAQILLCIYPERASGIVYNYREVETMSLDKAYEALRYGFQPEELWPHLFRRY